MDKWLSCLSVGGVDYIEWKKYDLIYLRTDGHGKYIIIITLSYGLYVSIFSGT